ncbi:hypothetical protein TNCV_1690971 [Trichonephila clavipes]|nr:hypothetical protein TNCV_1690971 [Trichonephila clavipes]
MLSQNAIIFIYPTPCLVLVHWTPSLPIPTDDVVRRIFIVSSALEPIMARLQRGHASSAAWPSQWRYTPKSPMDQGDFRLRRLGSRLGFLVDSLTARDPNMTYDPILIWRSRERNGVRAQLPRALKLGMAI